jgi:hypothetical protein
MHSVVGRHVSLGAGSAKRVRPAIDLCVCTSPARPSFQSQRLRVAEPVNPAWRSRRPVSIAPVSASQVAVAHAEHLRGKHRAALPLRASALEMANSPFLAVRHPLDKSFVCTNVPKYLRTFRAANIERRPVQNAPHAKRKSTNRGYPMSMEQGPKPPTGR